MTRPVSSPAPRRRSLRRAIGLALIVAGTLAIAVITLTPAPVAPELPLWCLSCGERPAVDVLLNVLLFMPLSIGMGLVGVPVRRALAFGILGSILIESLQFSVIPGRFPSVRDVLSNSSGTALGYLAGRQWLTLIAPSARQARSLTLAAAVCWVAVQAFTSWAMGVAAPPAPWWAQLHPDYDGYPAAFGGNVVRASLGSIAIDESDKLARSDEARRQLLAGAPFRAVLATVPPTPGRAMVVVITAGPDRDVTYWEQEGRAALFTIPVRGTFIGLRTPSVRLDDAIPSEERDSVTLAGSYAHGRYHLSAEGGGRIVRRDLAASPSLLWAFLLPLPRYSFGREVRVATALWVFALWLVLGYWGAPMSRTLSGAIVLGIAALTALAGFAAAPRLLDIPIAHWSEWLAAAGGFAIGFAIARRLLLISPDRAAP